MYRFCMISGSGRYPGVGNGNPLQYCCLKIPWTEEPGGLQSMGSQSTTTDHPCLYLMLLVFSRSVVSDSLLHHGLFPANSSVHGIFQARVLEWVAISFSIPPLISIFIIYSSIKKFPVRQHSLRQTGICDAAFYSQLSHVQ